MLPPVPNTSSCRFTNPVLGLAFQLTLVTLPPMLQLALFPDHLLTESDFLPCFRVSATHLSNLTLGHAHHPTIINIPTRHLNPGLTADVAQPLAALPAPREISRDRQLTRGLFEKAVATAVAPSARSPNAWHPPRVVHPVEEATSATTTIVVAISLNISVSSLVGGAWPVKPAKTLFRYLQIYYIPHKLFCQPH